MIKKILVLDDFDCSIMKHCIRSSDNFKMEIKNKIIEFDDNVILVRDKQVYKTIMIRIKKLKIQTRLIKDL